MRKVENLKSEKASAKMDVDAMEEELGKARRDVGAIAKDIQAQQKQIMSFESKIESKKSDRHNILKQCKMEDVVIPMYVGNMEDIAQEGTGSSENGVNESTDTTVNSTVQYEREARIKINYEMLPDKYKDLEEKDDVKKQSDKLLQAIKNLQDTITKIQAPNLRALQKLEEAQGKLQSTNEEFEALRKQNKSAKIAFEKVRTERYNRFNTCFEHVANEIDNIYKVS